MIIGGTTYPSWITLIKEYIKHENLPSEATLVKKMAIRYTIVGETL